MAGFATLPTLPRTDSGRFSRRRLFPGTSGGLYHRGAGEDWPTGKAVTHAEKLTPEVSRNAMNPAHAVKISEEELERAVIGTGLSPENAQAIWRQLQNHPDVEARFEAAHVGYYFGALLVIGAMGWFMTNGWDLFRGWQLFLIASGYAGVFVLVGRQLWSKPLFRIPAGLLITMAVCIVPLAVYGLERQFNLWPSADPGSYARFHPY